MKTDQRTLMVRGTGIASLRHVMIRLTPRPKIMRLIAQATLLIAAFISFGWMIQHCMSSTTDDALRVLAESALDFGFTEGTSTAKFSFENHGIRTKGAGSRKLLSAILGSKKEMLNELEGAVLEPPTNKESRRTTRYLPDLMGDSLASYPRRVFLDVGLAGRAGSEGWFRRHYPKRDLDFDIIRVDEVGNGGKEEGMTEWLRRNVKEEDYVVMKAEAEVVLEMVKGKTIGLVDELFLECSNQWHKGKKRGDRVQKSRRAYWECLALYGRLRDEGIAVHQWWD